MNLPTFIFELGCQCNNKVVLIVNATRVHEVMGNLLCQDPDWNVLSPPAELGSDRRTAEPLRRIPIAT